MLKSLKVFLVLAVCTCISSCAKQSDNEVYFIHAIGFDNAGKNIAVGAVVEKTSHGTLENASKNSSDDENTSQFELLRFEGQTTEKCYKKLVDFCKKAYFGTSETYFFSTGLTKENLDDISKFLPSEPNLPSRSIACAVDGLSACDFLKNAKDKTFFTEIKTLLEKEKINVISFLGTSYQGNQTVLLPALSYHEKPVNTGYAKCKNNHFEVQ